MKWIDSLKSLWEAIKPYGAVMIAGLMLIGGALASHKYLQLDLQNWEVIALIFVGLFILLLGFYRAHGVANTNRAKVTQQGEIITIRSADANASNSQIRIRIDNIESERCSANRVVGLPVNSAFQDDCLKLKNSSAGAYIDACLGGNIETHYQEILNMFSEVPKQIGSAKLIKNFLNRGDNIVFIAVTEKDTQGMITTTPINISYAAQELVRAARANQLLEVSCPVFGSGHGGVSAKVAVNAMIDGILSAFGVLGCNNMTVTIKVHHNTFSDIGEVKRALERA